MFNINISSLKNQLSAVLQKVKSGEEVLVVDRNQPIARLLAYKPSDNLPGTLDIVDGLIRQGAALPPSKKIPSLKWIQSNLAQTKGISAVQTLLKEREESR